MEGGMHGRGCMWWRACMVGACMVRVCMVGGVHGRGGMCGRGVCVAGRHAW